MERAITRGARVERNAQGVLRHVDPNFPEGRISTARSWAPGADADSRGGHDVSMALVRGDNPLADGLPAYLDSLYHKTANTIRGFDDAGKATRYTVPYVRLPERPAGALTSEQHLAYDDATHEALINHMESNIQAIHDAVPDDVKEGSAKWYDGGHEITKQEALAQDIPHENAAGVFAALSPRKDWDMNVNQARRVMHILSTTAPDARATPEMIQWMRGYADTKPLTGEKLIIDPKTGQPTGRTKTFGTIVTKQDVLDDLDKITSQPWSEMKAKERAVYIRAYDEAHGPPEHLMVQDERTGEPLPRGFHINNPDGSDSTLVARYGPEQKNMVDQPRKITFGSNSDIANAVDAYYATNMPQISEAMGEGHKVRSFYNSLIAPNSAAHDVTADTHAIAGALLRPLSVTDDEVKLGFGQGGPSSSALGTQGLYAHVREAYKRGGHRVGRQPREMQSIVWEAVRGLWNQTARMRNAVENAVGSHWQSYLRGEKTQDAVQRELLGPDGQNIKPPRWHGSWRP